jgi:inactive STAND
MVGTFRADYVVQIRNPKFGSGYRIGGRLVLTARHLFTALGHCRVKSEKTFGEVDAEVVWMSSHVDVALLELPESVEACESVRFGMLPSGNTGESVEFLFYGWPVWAWTRDDNQKARAGGRQIGGKICLADTSPDGLLVLRPNDYPKGNYEEKRKKEKEFSPWQGASGAVIICAGHIVAVQSQHQNPAEPESLEAAPLAGIYQDSGWIDCLSKHGIVTEPQQIQLGCESTGSDSLVASTAVRGLPSIEQRMAQALQDIGYGGQQKVFDDFLESDRVIEAFVVEVNFDDESDLQKCLVSRLSRDLIGGTSPMFRTLGVRREWQDNPLRLLTSGLAPDLGLAETADVKEVHECLLRLARTQSVVIALYEVPKMGNDSLAKLMDEFWYPLVKQVEDSQGQVVKKRILLFLAGVGPMVSLLEQANGCDTLDYPEAMDNIRGSDLEEWRRITRVKQLINCRQEIVPGIKDELKRFRPRSNAYKSMENVCEIFGFKGDLGQFEAFWQLSGDLVA